jgi:hypothetical protein
MAVRDDMVRLAALDVVYLQRYVAGSEGSVVIEWFRGRLRQALDGTWVFNTFAGHNGVVGIELGLVGTNWTSDESPDVGIQVDIIYTIMMGNVPTYLDIGLRSVLSSRFTE